MVDDYLQNEWLRSKGTLYDLSQPWPGPLCHAPGSRWQHNSVAVRHAGLKLHRNVKCMRHVPAYDGQAVHIHIDWPPCGCHLRAA